MCSQPFIEYFKNLVFINITERITLSIREKLFEKIIHAPLKFFDSVKKGEIISRVLNDGGALSSFLSKKLGILSLEVQTSLDDLCTVINQSCDKILPIKALSLEKLTVKEFKSASYNLHTSSLKISKYSVTLGTFLSVMVVSSLSIIYGYGAYLVMEGSLSIGQVVAMSPDILVLKNINMNIRNNEFAAIVGKSGSGKSTLINILMGFYSIPEGKIYIGGKDISKMGVEALRKNIGFVPQRIELLIKA
ncbi:MAG TPA: ABC transporter ATP-binding protein [Pseudobacteroides sp.]|uniref:ABC transporter ATP-binding protein n=1 Tax=Pseudobacteroides sp. TaxID=1968840 RepID=UPI002F9328E0